MLIIGITGGSGSGKTTVVKKILEKFPAQEVAIVHMDSYYKDNSHLSNEEKEKINFDHPDSLEFDRLYNDLLFMILLPAHAKQKPYIPNPSM